MNRRKTKIKGRRGNNRRGTKGGGGAWMGSSVLMHQFNGVPPTPAPRPKRGLMGANYSTRHLVESFTSSTAVSNSNQILALTTANNGSIANQIGDLDNFSALSATFDQYRIDFVEWFIQTVSNAVDNTQDVSPNQAVPQLYIVVDRDDDTALSGTSAARQYDNCMVVPASNSCHIRYRPSVTPAYYQAGSFVGYGTEESRWIDIASSAVPHYGIKFCVPGLGTSATSRFTWNVECYLHTSWRNSR